MDVHLVKNVLKRIKLPCALRSLRAIQVDMILGMHKATELVLFNALLWLSMFFHAQCARCWRVAMCRENSVNFDSRILWLNYLMKLLLSHCYTSMHKDKQDNVTLWSANKTRQSKSLFYFSKLYNAFFWKSENIPRTFFTDIFYNCCTFGSLLSVVII